MPTIIRADIPAPNEIVPRITFETAGETLVVTIKTAGASHVHISNSKLGLLLTFPGPLATIDTDALVNQSQGKLSSIEQGYDTILFSSDTMKLTDTSQFGSSLKAVFAPVVQPSPPAESTSGNNPAADETKLLLTRALISSHEGDFADATQTYDAAMKLSPNDPEVMTAYAVNEEDAGNWRHAQDLYHTAAAMDPDDQEASTSALRIDQEHQRYAGTDVEWRDLQGFGLVLATSTNAEQPITDDWRAEAQFDADHISTDSVRRLTGRLTSADQWANSKSVGAQYDDTDGVSAAGYLYSSYKFGVGTQVSLPTDSGHTLFGGEYDRANWDYLEGLVDDGTRDRLYVGQQEVFSHNLSGELIVGYNAYNLGTQRDLANGPAVAGELRYQLFHDNPSLALVYNLDAEYSVMTVKRTTPEGEQYEPFPLSNREVHTIIFDMDSPVSDFVNTVSNGIRSVLSQGTGLENLMDDYGQLDFFAGGGADRYGRGGPLVGGSLMKSYNMFEFQLRASYERGLDRESQDGTIVGGYVKARF